MDKYLEFLKHYCNKKISKTDFLTQYNFFSKVYSVLVEYGKASEHMRDNFILSHISNQKYVCTEYRFCGIFGLGGKYRRRTNSIDYYSEDSSPELDEMEKQINALLKEI